MIVLFNATSRLVSKGRQRHYGNVAVKCTTTFHKLCYEYHVIEGKSCFYDNPFSIAKTNTEEKLKAKGRLM